MEIVKLRIYHFNNRYEKYYLLDKRDIINLRKQTLFD